MNVIANSYMHAHAKRNKRRHHPYRLVNGEGVLQMCKSQRLLCAVTFTDVMTIWVHHLCWYRTATDGTDNLSSYRFPILHWSGPIHFLLERQLGENHEASPLADVCYRVESVARHRDQR